MIFTTMMAILIFLALFAIVVGFLLLYFKIDNVPGDNPIVYNFMTKFVPIATGLQIKRFPGPDREGMVIRKVDKSYLDIFKMKQKDKQEDSLIWFYEKQLNVFPKGTLSPERDIIILLPLKPEDLPEQFKETKIGRAFSMITEQNDFNRKEVEIIREYSNRKDNILKNWSGGEISTDLLSSLDKLFKDYMRTVTKDKENTKGNYSFGSPRDTRFDGV